jgi:hypothetical protein
VERAKPKGSHKQGWQAEQGRQAKQGPAEPEDRFGGGVFDKSDLGRRMAHAARSEIPQASSHVDAWLASEDEYLVVVVRARGRVLLATARDRRALLDEALPHALGGGARCVPAGLMVAAVEAAFAGPLNKLLLDYTEGDLVGGAP